MVLGRPIKVRGSSPRIQSYPIALKLEAAKYARTHSVSQAAREYKVDRKRIREWRNQEEKLKEYDNKSKRK